MNARIIWLKVGATVTIISGLLIALTVVSSSASELFSLALDYVFYPVDSGQSFQGEPARLLAAISGGLMVGLGAVFWLIASDVLPEHPALARKLILVGIGSWFLVDSSMSVAAGAPMNVLFNLGFLGIFVLPVWGLRPPAVHAAS